MINHINPSRLVRRISEALEIGGDGFVLSQLADDYAALCKDTAERVEQCAFLLERGDEFGAWKLASTPPDLLDLVAVLGFPRESEWRALCKERGYAVPSPFDALSVSRIGELYSKSIDESHSLYNAYRAAVRKRDETAALFAISAIVRKNPDDPHSKQEQLRLLAKRAAARAAELSVAVENGGIDEICRHLEVIESQGDAAAVPAVLLARARSLREEHFRKVERAAAMKRIAELKTLNFQADADAVGELVARITQAQEEFGFNLDPADAATLAGARDALVLVYREREAQRKQTAAIRVLEEAMVEVESMLLRGDKSPLEMAAERAKLHRLWSDLEERGRPVPEELGGRFQKLNTRIDAARRQKQLRRNVTWGVAVAVVIAGIAATGVMFHRARVENQFVLQFAGLREGGTAGEAGALLELVDKEHPELVQRPQLAGAINATRQWIGDQTKQAGRSETALRELEQRVAELGAGTALEKAVALPPLLADAEKSIGGLARDSRAVMEARLGRIKAVYVENQRAWAQGQQQQIEAALAAGERALAAAEACRRESEVEALLPAWIESNRQMEALFKEIQATVTMPAGQLARAQVVSAGLEKWQQNARAWQDAVTALSVAADYKVYGEVLQRLGGLLPVTDPLIEQARIVQTGWAQLDPAQLQQSILFAGEPAAQDFIRANPGAKPEPAAFPAFSPERAIYNGMKVALARSGLWRYQLQSAKGEVVILHSTEKPSRTDFPLPDGREAKLWTVNPIVRQEGEALVSESVTYKGTFRDGKLVDGWMVSGAAFAPELEFAKRYLGEEGINLDNGRFTHSPVKILDFLYSTPDLSPAFIAYVEQEIFKILELRPYHWGMHLSPTLQGYRLAFKARLTRAVQPADWLLPSQGREAEFNRLSAVRPRGYLAKEQEINGTLVREILAGKIIWAGYVTSDGKPLLQSWANQTLVFGLAPRSGLWRGLGHTSSGVALLPLTPLLGYATANGKTVDEIVENVKAGYASDSDKDQIKLIPLF